MDLRDAIRTQPMRPFQIAAIAVCIAISMIDGYEILVMGFVAPHLSNDWGVSQVEVGYLLSAGLFGMAVGAVFLAPLSDTFGRRKFILGSLLFIVVGMAASGMATSVPMLLVFRAFSGLFLGGIVPCLNTMAAEFSSTKRLGVVMGIYGVGFPGGAAIGGSLTTWLVGLGDWRTPFFFGAAVTLLMAVVTFFLLPESIHWITEKHPKDGVRTYNKISAKVGLPPVDVLPPPHGGAETKRLGPALFTGIMKMRTTWLWIGFICLSSGHYFANTWTPKLISDATGQPSLGVDAGVRVLIGGVLGALLFAALSIYIRPRLVSMTFMFAGTIAFTLFASNFESVGVALVFAIGVGMFANGGLASFYAISPTIYPAAVRGAAVGLMIGLGRFASIIAPVVTGYLREAGISAPAIYKGFAGVLVLAGIAVFLLDRSYRGRSEDPETPNRTIAEERQLADAQRT